MTTRGCVTSGGAAAVSSSVGPAVSPCAEATLAATSTTAPTMAQRGLTISTILTGGTCLGCYFDQSDRPGGSMSRAC
jgi:hypothetical protein